LVSIVPVAVASFVYYSDAPSLHRSESL
jgi:hypothetical protein